MLLALATAAALPTLAFSSKAPLGVSPQSVSLYTPITSTNPATWTCLDGSQTILYSAINDDYCDCIDGSDEPGTSACPNSTFYCVNEGHIGASIRSSRVNDGLCEPECCDGSDEPSGICPNQCQAIGEKYRAEQEAERKLRKTGSKIRSSYITYAKKEAARLKSSVASLEHEVETKRAEETRLKAILEHTESVDAAALEHQKQSPVYHSLVSHSAALKSLRAKQAELQAKLDTLEEILSGLKRSYNPNYQDMGVLEAVRGWDAYHGVEPEPVINQAEDSSEAVVDKEIETPEPPKEDEWTTAKLDELAGVDHVALMLEQSRYMGGSENHKDKAHNLLDNLQNYIPPSLVPLYTDLKGNLRSWLAFLHILPSSALSSTSNSASDAATNARNAHNTAVNNLKKVERDLKETQESLNKLEGGGHLGKDGEWKKLDGTCLEKDTGEYTYSVCLFGSATQKSNKDHSSHNLGRFSSWSDKEGVSPGDYQYYTRQYYKGGARCWNGPERSVVLDLTCGTENEILTIAEPEKCEYLFTGTSPALCWPLEEKEKEGKAKEEL